jgi:hypothetical protein
LDNDSRTRRITAVHLEGKMEHRTRPDTNESAAQRERYDAAQVDFGQQSDRINKAANTFKYSSQDFHALEDEFLALIEELRRTSLHQIQNLAHLEGLRIRLLTSFDNGYRHAVNELVDSLLASIGQNAHTDDGPDKQQPEND